MAISYQYTADGYEAGEVEDYGLPPNNSTRDPWPPAKKGFIRRRVGAKWIYVEDHKGKNGYVNGQPHEIKEYGPLPDGWSDTPPPPTLTDVQTAKRQEINSGYQSALRWVLSIDQDSDVAAIELAILVASDLDTVQFIGTKLAAHRSELLDAVDVATTVEAVQAIAVSYAV